MAATGAIDKIRWNNFIADLDGLRESQTNPLHKQSGVQLVADNVWLVNFQDNPAALAWLVTCAVRRKLHYGILQLNDPPQWIPAGFDPMAS